MSVIITELLGFTKAELAGRLDSANVNRLEPSFIAGIVPKGRHTVVDLSQVTFIASLGIRMLLSAARALSRQGARLIMYGASPVVMEIIETTALSDIIPALPSEADAIAELGG